jgi:hypothetical protein
MAPLSNACARRLLLSLCSVASSARNPLFCSAKAPYAAPKEPAFVGLIEEGVKPYAKFLGGRLGWEIDPSALPKPEVSSSFFLSLWKNRPLPRQTLLACRLQPGCGVVKAAGLHGGAGQSVQNGAVAAEQNLPLTKFQKTRKSSLCKMLAMLVLNGGPALNASTQSGKGTLRHGRVPKTTKVTRAGRAWLLCGGGAQVKSSITFG